MNISSTNLNILNTDSSYFESLTLRLEQLKEQKALLHSENDQLTEHLKKLADDMASHDKKVRQLEQTNAKQRKHIRYLNEQLRIQKGSNRLKASALEQSLYLVRKSYDQLESFSYVMSHDVLSPLSSIRLGLMSLLETSTAEETEMLKSLITNSESLIEMVRELHTYSTIGKKGIIRTEVDFQQLLDNVWKSLSAKRHDTGAVLLTSGMPTLNCSGALIGQLFQNLIENSIKYRGQEKPVIEIRCRKLKSLWEIEVGDNGSPISSDSDVFRLFERGGKKDCQGKGIGLATCKKIVELHGGSIWHRNNEKGGSTFTFTLRTQQESVEMNDTDEIEIIDLFDRP